jgi:isopentenyl-diphosphate delta-isomerase
MEENRKLDHIELTTKAQVPYTKKSEDFYYEPLFGSHPKKGDVFTTQFLNHQLNFPLWISSMTGGASKARTINHNLALMCKEFKIGMGLGSCRSLLNDDFYFNDFNLRPIIGIDLPLFANIGIAQLEQLVLLNQTEKLHFMVDKLKATGLIIHINPIQEWMQPEGDRLLNPPIETLTTFLKNKKYPIIVKEVGQGFGPRSLKALLDLEVEAIELAGFGGTNFSMLELLRDPKRKSDINSFPKSALAFVGHDVEEMIKCLNSHYSTNPIYQKTEVIISGGILNPLQGLYYANKLKSPSVIGLAKRALSHAENLKELEAFFIEETETLLMGKQFLENKNEN